MNKYADQCIKLGNMASICGGLLYLYSMIIHPLIHGGWKNTHEVWAYWQSLNVGILAFFASVIAFNTARYNANNQRARELIAARAFLPHALSDLSAYLERCCNLLKDAYIFAEAQAFPIEHVNHTHNIDPPYEYAKAFERCITLADSPLSGHLCEIISKLQINEARLEDFPLAFHQKGRTTITKHNVIHYMYGIAEIQCMINATFAYSRGEEEFRKKYQTWLNFAQQA